METITLDAVPDGYLDTGTSIELTSKSEPR